MSDYKGQLAAIRCALSAKVEPAALDSVQPTKTPVYIKVRRRVPQRGVDGETKELAFEQLPWLGKIEHLRDDYGFILSKNGRLFFHRSGWVSRKNRAFSDLARGKSVVFATGTHEDGRQGAIRWALTDDISWPEGASPKTQPQLNEVRSRWLIEHGLGILLSWLTADWYRQSFKGREPPRDLTDPALERAVLAALGGCTPQEWRANRVEKAISSGLYRFLAW